LVAYFEGKWWKNQSAAVFDANEQATSFTRGDVYPEGEVSGAYIAILDWQVSEDNCSVTVKRVW
jgi:hypothetical protein